MIPVRTAICSSLQKYNTFCTHTAVLLYVQSVSSSTWIKGWKHLRNLRATRATVRGHSAHQESTGYRPIVKRYLGGRARRIPDRGPLAGALHHEQKVELTMKRGASDSGSGASPGHPAKLQKTASDQGRGSDVSRSFLLQTGPVFTETACIEARGSHCRATHCGVCIKRRMPANERCDWGYHFKHCVCQPCLHVSF